MYPPSNNVYNPYSQVDPNSQLSGWNKFTDWLGITNHAGQMQYQHSVNSSLWQSEYDLAMQDREYNNELNTAMRMRQAGLNPDIHGVNAGQSSLSGNPASSPMTSPNSQLNTFGTAINSVFQTVLGVASGVSQINLANANADFSIFNDVFSKWKKDSVDLALSANDPSKLLSILSSAYTSGNRELIRSIPVAKFESPFRTKRAKKLISNYQENYLYNDGLRQDIVRALGSNYTEVLDSNKKAAAIDGYTSDSNKDLREVLGVLAKAEVDVWRKRNQVEYKSLSNSFTYENNINPKLQAQAVNADNNEAISELNMRLNLKSVERQMVDKLAKLADKGNVLSQAALIAFSQFNNFEVNVDQRHSFDKYGRPNDSSNFHLKL